ncbi:hypothetical protein [Streptomyces sp. HB132]|uniref:hypothetical protein n=1 Tax=Streptomyces sp. HB132 TaxID=767388 RepID=UPI001960217E|nr:hypothetical protein [Streptomyces sp. HB132]MBM7441416.1 hypothetical protein [Streptomyces sp. HB132]
MGDAVQRGVDSAAYAWQLDEQAHIDEKEANDVSQTFETRQNYLKALGEEWSSANPDHTLSDAENERLRTGSIASSAFNGNSTANRISGDLP